MHTQMLQPWLYQSFVVHAGYIAVGLGQNHLQHVDSRAEKRPLFAHLRQNIALAPFQRLAQGSLTAQPRGQHQPRLGPGENPRDRPQAFDPALTAFGRAAAQWNWVVCHWAAALTAFGRAAAQW